MGNPGKLWETPENNGKQLKNIEHVEVIDPIKHLCKDGLCKTRDEKAFFYRDYNHMRPWYSIKANSYLDAIFLT